jgi:hypothetical protein
LTNNGLAVKTRWRIRFNDEESLRGRMVRGILVERYLFPDEIEITDKRTQEGTGKNSEISVGYALRA